MRIIPLLVSALFSSSALAQDYREAVEKALRTPNDQKLAEGSIEQVVKNLDFSNQDLEAPVNPALAYLYKVWELDGYEQFKRAILIKIASFDNPFTINIFRQALDSENVYLRRLAVQHSHSSTWLSADDEISKKLKEISETSRFRRERHEAQAAIDARLARKTPLLAALQNYREQAPAEPAGNIEELSLAIYKAALNSLSFSDASFGIATGWIDAFGKTRAKPALLWENGELVLQLMETIFQPGNNFRTWLGYELFENTQQKISDWAGQRAFESSVIERIFHLASHFHFANQEWYFPKNYSENRARLILRTLNHEKKNETVEQSEAVVKNVRIHLAKLPRDLQDLALHALGLGRREAALPYLLQLADNEDINFVRLREAALVGLQPFADRPEVLERARTVGKNFVKDRDQYVSLQALALLGRHFVEIKRLGTDPNPLALEISHEIWKTNETTLQEQLIQSLSVAHYLAVEDFYVEVLKSSRFEMQMEIMERIVRSGLRDSKKLELAMVNLSESAQYEKQRQIVRQYLQRLDAVKARDASCAAVVAHVEGHNGQLLE